MQRRAFLSTTGLAFAGLHRLVHGAATADPAPHFGPLARDPEGILDLPEGFTYRVISRAGQPMSDGFKVPGVPDGMAAFGRPDGRIALIRNHELDLKHVAHAPFEASRLPDALDPARCHDPGENGALPHFGGTSHVIFDPATGETVDQFLSLLGTDRNCAGGPMPWGSWITCEEPEDLVSARGLRHGWCFEVRAEATGLEKPEPLTALGRFRHEAVALDPATGILYLTEDRPDGLLYRFVPDNPADPATRLREGKLQALAVADRPRADLRNYDPSADFPAEGRSFEVGWIDLEEIHAPADDLRLRGHRDGAARFARGEGIHHTADGIFICCTDGGPARRGQIFRLKPSGDAGKPDTLELFLQSKDDGLLNNGDNLCPAPWGGLVLCEDLVSPLFSAHTHLRWVSPQGRIETLARNARDNSEFAGSCFSPDGKWLFANLQGHGLTLAITGPWPG